MCFFIYFRSYIQSFPTAAAHAWNPKLWAWYSHKLICQESKNLAELFSQTLRGMLAGSFHQDDMKHHIFFGLGDPKLNLHVPRFTVTLGGVKGASPTSFSYGVMVCVCVFFLWTCQNEYSLDLFLSKLLTWYFLTIWNEAHILCLNLITVSSQRTPLFRGINHP